MIRLVIVDDNPMVLGGLRALFEAARDFAVVGEGTNGAEAIAAARESDADIVLMDLSMPKMDGIVACRRLAVECPATRVIVYSALGGEDRIAAAMAAGATDYVGKDLPPDELVARVRSIAVAAGPVAPSRDAEPPTGTGPGVAAARPSQGGADPGAAAVAAPRGRRAVATDGPAEAVPTIGILAPLLAGAYMTELMLGVSAAADAAGLRLIAIQTLDPSGLWPLENRLPEAGTRVPTRGLRVSWDRVGGFLVVLDSVEPDFLDAVARAGKPVVVIAGDIEGFRGPTVRADNRTGVMQAVAHLVEHGHRRIAFAGYRAQSDTRERLEAYRDALAIAGIDLDESLVFAAPDNLESGGEAAARSMLAAGLPSTAVVVATDFNAIGIMKVLGEAGLSLPHDQAVVGFDDVAAGLSTRPTLSTVHQSAREIGRTAFRLLADGLTGRPLAPGPHLVPTAFVPRESCGCVRVPARDRPAGYRARGGRRPRDASAAVSSSCWPVRTRCRRRSGTRSTGERTCSSAWSGIRVAPSSRRRSTSVKSPRRCSPSVPTGPRSRASRRASRNTGATRRVVPSPMGGRPTSSACCATW
ncbi:MAG: substrate-binding domain-containing protein [Candidatus Dormibacteria bacterium]